MYKCSQCGYTTARPYGLCPKCRALNSFVKVEEDNRSGGSGASKRKKRGTAAKIAKIVPLSGVSPQSVTPEPTGIAALDIVLGGGVIPGGVYLFTGAPGSGKSTLLTMASLSMSAHGNVVYLSGEETKEQLRRRVERLTGSDEVGKYRLDNFYADDGRDIIAGLMGAEDKGNVKVVVVDSIQSMLHPEVDGGMGGISQVRSIVGAVVEWAKRTRIPVFLVGQVTKDDDPAGPRLLEHWVDAHFGITLTDNASYRVIKATKNRFFTSDIASMFEMTENGAKSITNPSAVFLSEDGMVEPGIAVGSHILGESMGLLVTVEAYVSPMKYQYPSREVLGIPRNTFRLLTLTASLLGMGIGDSDIALKVWGGVQSKDPAIGLAVIAAILSRKNNAPLGRTVFVGEVSLSGLVTGVPFMERRVRDAMLNNVSLIVVPQSQKHIAMRIIGKRKINIVGVKHIRELLPLIRRA